MRIPGIITDPQGGLDMRAYARQFAAHNECAGSNGTHRREAILWRHLLLAWRSNTPFVLAMNEIGFFLHK
jgi:hypothetical protein